MLNPALQPIKVIVVVLQHLLRTAPESYESYADLKEDLKCQLAKLHIPYDGELIAAALDRVELGGQAAVIDRPAILKPVLVEKPVEQHDPSPEAARAILDRLRTPVPLPSMPAVRQLTIDEIRGLALRADQRKAFEIVLKEIQATEQRCAELDDETKKS
jgi:hypothetical protein